MSRLVTVREIVNETEKSELILICQNDNGNDKEHKQDGERF